MPALPRAAHCPPLPTRPVLACGLLLGLALLSGCGGGGEKESVVPTVSSTSVRSLGTLGGGEGSGNYGEKVLITVNGSALDQGITVRSNGCTGITRLSSAPTISGASTAYYECTVSSAGNFMEYVRSGFYVGTIFHRYSPNFVLQGGGYAAPLSPQDSSASVKEGTREPIVLEDAAGLSNLQWTVAMARTNAPNSATSQFFFNLVDNLFLNRSPTARGYAVFAEITGGREVVTAMTQQPCSAFPPLGLSGGECLPAPNLVITAARQTR